MILVFHDIANEQEQYVVVVGLIIVKFLLSNYLASMQKILSCLALYIYLWVLRVTSKDITLRLSCNTHCSRGNLQRAAKVLVRGLVKFVTAFAY